MTETVRSDELDVNGIPKLVRNLSGVSKNNSDNVSGSVTGMRLYNTVNAIVDLIKAPGPWFNTNEYGLNYGVIFLGVVGTIIAVAAIAIGVPGTHAQAPPSMIFGFAPY